MFFILLYVLNISGYSQQDLEKKGYYNWFDALVGEENSELYNGFLFINEFENGTASHRFFDSGAFVKGYVIYDDQVYFDQNLLYDLITDTVLINPKNTSERIVVELKRLKVSNFSIKGHKFRRINCNIGDPSNDFGFAEIISEENSSTLIKKHRKEKEKKIKDGIVVYKFNYKSNYYLLYNNSCYPIDKPKDWIRVFPDRKKDIMAYYKSHNSLRKTDRDSFMKLMFKLFLQTPSF